MSSLIEELNKQKTIEDVVQPNRMAKFAYTEKAYEDNDASGVDNFNFDADQNIPSDKLSVLQVNETVINKGFRAQASSVTRQLLDHFFGRASYNLNKAHDVIKGVIDAFVKFIGKPNGVATLGADGKVPYSQLPESTMEFKGIWDAKRNIPTLSDGVGKTGDFYVVSVAGTQNLGSGSISFLENDRVIYSDGVWVKLASGSVKTVNNIQPVDGNVTVTGDTINFSADDTTKVSTKVTSHMEATTDVHGATTSSAPNTIVLRNATGKIQVDTPYEDLDVANKKYVDDSISAVNTIENKLDTHIAATTEVHGATSEATANRIAIRDSAGRMQVADPVNDLDVTNKRYIASVSSKPGKPGISTRITSSGTQTITPGWYLVEVWGAGGAGGGKPLSKTTNIGSNGGCGGAYKSIFMYINTDTIDVTIGIGGASSSKVTGNNGTPSSVSIGYISIVAAGGAGGSLYQRGGFSGGAPGGEGGHAVANTDGSFSILNGQNGSKSASGVMGGVGGVSDSNTNVFGGGGGGAGFAKGGTGGDKDAKEGKPGGIAAGGGGCTSGPGESSYLGGKGGDGLVILTLFNR